MNSIEAGLLGVIQGFTEFFPVSSSGHLVLFQELFGGREGGELLFEVAVHLATVVAIVSFYRKRIVALLLGILTRGHAEIEYVGKLALATLPSVVVGLSAKNWIESQFSNPILLWRTEFRTVV